jgi:predicted short-subunit dehydrogenase-like oxidoreductase (DUF2520 family)
VPTVRIIGPGRAGQAFGRALSEAGWDVLPILGRADDPSQAAAGVDAVVLAVPDDALPSVVAAVRPEASTVLVHLAGSLGPDVLSPHERRAALHPLVALPDPATGAERLRSGITFAVAGDPFAETIATALGGRVVGVDDAARPAYHAAAAVAANHVTALLGQVERIAASAGLPLEAFLPLARAAVEDAGRLGPRHALTGPAARGDWQTLARHVDAIPESERAAYRAGVGLALALVVGAEAVHGGESNEAPSAGAPLAVPSTAFGAAEGTDGADAADSPVGPTAPASRA